MNPGLRSLLEAGGVAIRSWSDVTLLNNFAGLPAGEKSRGDYIWNRGFNLLVLDPTGRPAHYCKCRRADDAYFAHETRVRETLGTDRTLDTIVPRTRGVASAALQVQVSRHLPGEPFNRLVPRLSLPRWERALDEILAAVERVTARTATLLPDLAPPAAGVVPSTEAAWALNHLSGAGVPQEAVARLARALDHAGRLPGLVQHGDLWPGNVVWYDGSWWILDFEMFARIAVPLYDAFHLVRASWNLRPGGRVPLLTLLRDPEAGACSRRVLGAAAKRVGLTPVQLGGAFVAYAVDIAARLHRREMPSAFWQPYVADLERVDDALAASTPLEDLVPLRP